MLPISPLNCFLAGTTHVLTLCNTFLDGAFHNVFRAGFGVLILNMLGIIMANVSLGTLFANGKGLIPECSGLDNNMVMAFCPASSDVLLATKCGSIDVYTDGFVKSLGFIDACSDATAYFPKANANIGVKILGLLSSMLVELQVIALALECVLDFSTKEHIHQAISNKNLSVTWRKVKRHSDVIENKHVDFFANMVTLSKSVLFLSIPCCFLSVENRSVSGNTRYFFRNLFKAINFVSWEFKFGADIVDIGFAGNINSSKSFSVWHLDGGICSGYIGLFSAFLRFYLMKFLHCHLPVAVRKRLYDLKYPNMVCIKCGMIENSDHLFLCKHDNVARLNILLNISMKWCKMAGEFAERSKIMQFLSETEFSNGLYILLAKGFVLKSWVSNAILCLGLVSGSGLIVKLVCNLAESHRSDIWLPAAKLRAFYEKHNLLPCDGFAVPLINSLSNLWDTSVIYGFGFRLGVYLCFGLCSCFTKLGFGFLNSIPLTDPAYV
ncbi:hypothetical protein G9A89_022216 [Geosiphon pyriformis]|nr:hypothetical protein G9A89_022216 [Geosiphon pyriformis]